MGRTSDLRRVLLYTVAVIMASFGITSMASAQSVITNTGPNSFNSITSDTNTTCAVNNTNSVSALNQTTQNASSGSTLGANNQSSLLWTGWASLSPTTAQIAGTSYNAWHSEVTDWIAARASGAGWNSASNNLTWTPSDSDWPSFDPMLWQASGQTFSNWLNATEAYLNNNSTTWILGWPASATSGAIGNSAVSGAATNNNNANFSISISNAAAPATTAGCSSTSTGSGGMGGGPGSTTTGDIVAGAAQNLAHSTSNAPAFTGGSGGMGQGVPQSSNASSPTGVIASSRNAGNQSQSVANGSSSSLPSGSSSIPSSGSQGTNSGASISNTGPCSTNIISSNTMQNTTINNVNTVNVTNTTTQTATSGSSTTADNGYGSGTSGDASNNNSTGLNTGFSS